MSAVNDARELADWLEATRGGDRGALDRLVRAIADGVYRLALRMTANVADAEDATQEALIKVITHLGTFRGDASVRTWAYRITVTHLLDRRKGAVESIGLDFEKFGADLLDGLRPPAQTEDPLAVEEVKLGCTLAMLTCLDRDQRIAYILGEVFDLAGDVAADIAGVTPQVYRQRLSRARRQLEAFTTSYCGLVNERAPCSCEKRVARAAELGRLQRERLVFARHPREKVGEAVREMEDLHATAALFRSHPQYRAPEAIFERLSVALARLDIA